jgi:hypothetical protein
VPADDSLAAIGWRRTSRGLRPTHGRGGARHRKLLVQGKYFAVVFGPARRVAPALERQGVDARIFDRGDGPGADPALPQVLGRILQDVRTGRVAGVMMGLPARDTARWGQPAGRETPPPPGSVADGDAATAVAGGGVRGARSDLLSAFRLARACLEHGVPFIIEHPAGSNIYAAPEIQELLGHADVAFLVADQCQYGARWRKPTGFIVFGIDDHHRLQARCHARHGICSFRHKPHLQLRGHAPSGVAWTAVASSYPARLGDDLAHCLLERERGEYMSTWDGRAAAGSFLPEPRHGHLLVGESFPGASARVGGQPSEQSL